MGFRGDIWKRGIDVCSEPDGRIGVTVSGFDWSLYTMEAPARGVMLRLPPRLPLRLSSTERIELIEVPDLKVGSKVRGRASRSLE